MKKQIIANIEIQSQEITRKVNAMFPSVFTKDDVLLVLQEYTSSLLNTINLTVPEEVVTTTSTELTEQEQKDLVDYIVDELENVSWEDAISVDNDSAEFELSGNSLYLDSVDTDFDYGSIERHVRRYVGDSMREFFVEKKRQEEEAKQDEIVTA